MSLVRTRGDYLMDLVDSVPITDVNVESVKLELTGHCKYFNNAGLRFNITDVNLTEWDNNRNPVITHLARKKRINVTISGYIDEPFKVRKGNVKNADPDRPDIDYVNIQDKNLNLTFSGIRIIRDKIWHERLQTVITPPKLMIDNTHELYGFLKPIYVNKGEMSLKSEKNIYISFQELVELLKDSTVNLGVTDVDKNSFTHYYWITECKKGDSNGVKSH